MKYALTLPFYVCELFPPGSNVSRPTCLLRLTLPPPASLTNQKKLKNTTMARKKTCVVDAIESEQKRRRCTLLRHRL